MAAAGLLHIRHGHGIMKWRKEISEEMKAGRIVEGRGEGGGKKKKKKKKGEKIIERRRKLAAWRKSENENENETS